MRHLRAGSISVVVTSPPYNIGIRYSRYNDRKPRSEYLDWIGETAQGVKRVLADNGSFFLNVGSTPKDPWLPLDVAQRLREAFVLQNVIHWVKSIAISKGETGKPNLPGDFSAGHYKPIGGTRFLNDAHEYIFHLTKTGNVPLDRLAIGVPYQDKSNVGRWKAAQKDLRCRGNTWFIPYQTIWNREEQRPHPSTFPERLPEMCIQLHGLSRTHTVLDPFLGLGSTALAAYRLGVSFTGYDIDGSYLSEAKRRLKAEVSIITPRGPSPVRRRHRRLVET
jgi:site-specific DNA-methyltransferase (adenine-specific)